MYKVISTHTASGLEKAMNDAAAEGYRAIGTVSVVTATKTPRKDVNLNITTFTHVMEK